MFRYAALLLCTAMMSGCFVDLLGATAITSTLQKNQLETGQRVIERTTDRTARINLEQAIATFQADKGHFPATLNDLAPGYIREIPMQASGKPFGYDPATGRLFDSPGEAVNAAGPTPSDMQKIQQINQAINAYGHATGWYPPTLEALVPQYMASVPYTDSGHPFLYNNQNGDVRHPNAHQQPYHGGGYNAPRGGSAAGPMGEALTGIQMQQQLQNMNQSGAAAAGSRARENINQQREQQNERQQNQLLHDLGV
jgi:hypothetical protein